MTRLYGIVEYLGNCKETEDMSFEIKNYIPSDRFNIDRYKAFKPLSTNESGVRVFKGFADANTLASISKTNKYYQRAIDKKHSKEIEQYIIKSSPDRFYFPEVTLLYEYDPSIEPEKLPLKPIVDMFANKKDIEIISILGAIGVYSLEIADNELYRLDGNHRLEALGRCAKEGLTKNFKQNKMVSFCIILTPKTAGYSFEHLYFYLLNSKALPIHSLKTLEIITQANKNGEMKEFIENDTFLSIMNQTRECWGNFSNKEKEVLISVVGEMIATQNTNKLINIIKASVEIYNGEKYSDINTKAQMLGVICWLRLKYNDVSTTKENLTGLKKWIHRFKYDISNFKKFGDLYEAFTKYNDEMQRKRYIFVAMEFNKTYIEEYKSAIGNVIQQIRGRDSRINLELIDIMKPSGDVVIPQKIFDDIDKCDIFIADISTNNINVMLEYGYAKGKEGKYAIVFYNEDWNSEVLKELEKTDTNHIKKIKADLQNKPFDIRVNNHNKWKNKNELEEKLQQEFGNYLKENQLD